MKRAFAILSAVFLAGSVQADEDKKQSECQFQADLIGAVQQARLDRVRKNKVSETLVAANPDWPETVGAALPAVVEYVYQFKRRDLRETDLAATTLTTCLENYDQIQALKESVSN